MPVRYHAQRQHIVRSLDQILYQLHTVSFFLSPSLLPYLSRVLFQFQFAKPREVDPERSLRFWFFLVCVFNLGSVWTHATESPAQTGNSILLDFVGPAAIPSRLQLLLLDLAIILLDMLLAAISYEAALYESSPKDSPDPLLPIPPQTSPSPTPLPSTPSPSPPQSPSSSPTMLPTYAYPPKPPSATGVQTPYVMDVHLNMIYRRLRDPAPPAPERDARIEAEDLLPLPNTTPSDITVGHLGILNNIESDNRQLLQQDKSTRYPTSFGQYPQREICSSLILLIRDVRWDCCIRYYHLRFIFGDHGVHGAHRFAHALSKFLKFLLATVFPNVRVPAVNCWRWKEGALPMPCLPVHSCVAFLRPAPLCAVHCGFPGQAAHKRLHGQGVAASRVAEAAFQDTLKREETAHSPVTHSWFSTATTATRTLSSSTFPPYATMVAAIPEQPSQRWKRWGGKIFHGFREFIFGGRHFCCCIPTRFGVVVGACLQFLVAGALAIILWFEVSTSHDFTFSHLDRVGFICAGLLETLLFVAAILGFVGAIVRKQVFVTAYCIFLYFHFLINLGAASFLTWKINHTTTEDVRAACEAIKNSGTQSQCQGLLGTTRGILLWIIWVVILIEFYGVLIVTRYVRQLRNEKRHGHGQNYTSLGDDWTARRHSRVASRRNLDLSEELYDEDPKARSPLPTPGSAGSSYKSTQAATFFPLMPSIPLTPGVRIEGERRHSNEEVSGSKEAFV
ncbi:hypothetical protein NM688_g7732 [Phlebia brevispora]|uniref:Uncharacterized protein n=1 Tax=Phlebia brevispora TaxID=194682 RepID=A0ACC1S1R2_9APHY|nr:hypothetical protein NM688_g7732 [Phlebia brevispora]